MSNAYVFESMGLNPKPFLRDVLAKLPEPILIVGNRSVDADSAGCVAALLEETRMNGQESYTFFSGLIEDDLAWMFDETDTSPTILEDYASLVVVDDVVESRRLGIPIKEGVPIVNIDHHMGRIPPEAKPGGKMFIAADGNVLTYWADLPATACLLIREEIYHPYLWLSLFTDSVGFTVRGPTAVKYAYRLCEGLKEAGIPFLDADQEAMHQKWSRIGTLQSFSQLLDSKIYTFGGTYKESAIQIILGVVDCPDGMPAFNALETFRAYSDVSVVVNQKTGRCSIRSRRDDYDVCAIAKKFGGGGHIKASGFSLELGPGFEERVDCLIENLLTSVTNVRTKMYL